MSGTALGQPAPADSSSAPLAQNRFATVTKQDLEVELLRLPPDLRPGFWNQPRRVYDLVDRVLINKSLSAEARARGIDRDPGVADRTPAEIDRFLAFKLIQGIEEKAAAEYEARSAGFEARARELYRVDRDRYTRPEQVSAWHILFKLDRHSSDEARKLADDARTKVLSGADFKEVARASSEDPSVAQNAGFLDYFSKKAMDPAFAEAAFALKKPGDVSEPVLSRSGWHVIKLEGRKEASVRHYEEVRGEILAELKRKYVDEQRDAFVNGIRGDPSTKVDRAAIDALIVRPDLKAAPRAGQAPPPVPPGAPAK